jgi:PAS domain S-box-containing protein
LIVDFEANILNANQALCRLLEYDYQDLIGKNIINDFTHPDDIDTSIEALNRLTEFYWLEKRYVTRTGNVVWVKVTVIRDEKYLIGTVEDFTHLYQLQNQLGSTQKDLQKFIYIVSHDLQEPIRTAFNYVEVLGEMFSFSDEAGEAYEIVTSSLTWIQKLIRSLVRYSRIGSLTVTPVSVKAVFEQVKMSLDLLAKEKKAKISNTCNSVVNVSEVHLQSLLQNLIHNALKYSDQPIIKISGIEKDRWVQITVEDNGMGIDERYHETIFLVFKRLSNDQGNGTGIGLAECKRIVELYGGKIWVESSPQNGSKFIFTLPKG